jgi:manganese/zinc/iron transport system permease protein
MLLLSCFFGIFAGIAGYWLANLLDASIAGSMTTVLGIVFLLVYLFAPKQGVVSVLFKEKQQRKEVSLLVFLLHLQNHREKAERHVNHLREHINWQKVRARTVLDLAQKNNLIFISENIVSLTDKGREFTDEALRYITTNKETAIEELKERYFLFRG